MTKRTHKIPPDQTLMEDIGATNFTLAEAVVELVANSIDARPPSEEDEPMSELTVDVLVEKNRVVVMDDAVGMTEDILVEAVRLGVKMDKASGRGSAKVCMA